MTPTGADLFGRYLRYDELRAALDHLASLRPGWMAVEALTSTPEGRELVAVTVTDPRTGPASEKPAFYVDANIHARELPGGPVCLRLLHELLSGAERPEIAALLADNAFYVIPRVAVDGVEALLTGRAFVRSAPRPWPDEEPPEGLVPQDMDGDGEVRQMRIPDPAGGWMVDPRDARLMVPRPMDAALGPFYRLLPEGAFVAGDPRLFQSAREPNGLDFNRNFPAFWKVEKEQRGAGPHPLSEPETLALARFITSHPNICGLQALHTGIEVIIPPEGVTPYSKFSEGDRAWFEALGARGEDILGMPFASIMAHGYPDCAGDFGEWAFSHRGIPGLVVELWSLPGRAGVKIADHLAAWAAHPHRWADIELKCLQWADEHLGHEAFAPWRAVEHPQLGTVEIGGWQRGLWSAPPPGPHLDDLSERAVRYLLTHAAASPRLRLPVVECRRVAADLFVLSAFVENAGHLPTWLTEHGRGKDLIPPIRAWLDLPEGARLEVGRPRVEVGQLGGRGKRAQVDWLVRGDEGATVTLSVAAEKGGTVRAEIVLG